MSPGLIISVIMTFITTGCGVILASRPYPLRWNGLLAKVILGVIVAGAAAFASSNLYWAKYSTEEYYLRAVYLTIIIVIFFKGNFWKMFCQNLLYWWMLTIIFQTVIIVIGFIQRISPRTYGEAINGMPWYKLHIGAMVGVSILVLVLARFKKETAFLEFNHRVSYILLIIPILLNLFIDPVFYSQAVAYRIVTQETLISMLLFANVAGCVIVILTITHSVYTLRQKELQSEQAMTLLENQYEAILQQAEQRSRWLHDSIQQDILLLGYLNAGETEQAQVYLRDRLEEKQRGTRLRYTGISAMDYLLEYKSKMFQEYHLRFQCDADAMFCPFPDEQICIILGNLLDNGMEAAREVESSNRWIHLTIRTENKMFYMEMQNPYTGQRKIINGTCETTKADGKNHGIGLKSVRELVEGNGGTIDISAANGIFSVRISVIKK
ncbi:MAG TPA: GHKL domain-containing protein [Candidatus Scybalocola faecigallinarum]|uniref:GHKL domain-containing protein n=1 Tax=Candidatus Scybalocola faecigallinarum TaxID=2840941 RepID=A0A9D1JQB3_9FIRM|nr:GHKL domain-containing protein [Candidatus Scybalocola faecigallinarum]